MYRHNNNNNNNNKYSNNLLILFLHIIKYRSKHNKFYNKSGIAHTNKNNDPNHSN